MLRTRVPTAAPYVLLAWLALVPATTASSQSQCIVPTNELIAVLGKDAIPPLEYPDFVPAEEDAFLRPSFSRIVGVEVNGELRAYPVSLFWWHEIINDTLGGVPIVVTYCPLTGSVLAFQRDLDGEFVKFGNSGILLDNNLVMYDRATESLWSQMKQGAICGAHAGRQLHRYPATYMRWDAWKLLHPDTTLATFDTGWDRDYLIYPYGDYESIESTEILYPLSIRDTRLPLKALVLGVLNGAFARAYSVDRLRQIAPRVAVNDQLHGLPLVVISDIGSRMIVAFERKPRIRKRNGKWKAKKLRFDVVAAEDEDGKPVFPFLLRDRQTKTLWSLEGVPIEGKLVGRVEHGGLRPVESAYTAFWFAWAAFNPGTEIY